MQKLEAGGFNFSGLIDENGIVSRGRMHVSREVCRRIRRGNIRIRFKNSRGINTDWMPAAENCQGWLSVKNLTSFAKQLGRQL